MGVRVEIVRTGVIRDTSNDVTGIEHCDMQAGYADVNYDVSQEQKPARKLIDYVEILSSTPVPLFPVCAL